MSHNESDDATEAGRDHRAEFLANESLWVELNDSGFVRVDGGWVYVYSEPEMLPGGMVEGPTESEIDVPATEISGERLLALVGPDVGVILDYEYTSEQRIQVPLIRRVVRDTF